MQVKSREGNGNLLQYSCPGNPMDRGGGQSTQYMRLKKVEHSLATKQQQRANTNVLTTEARSLHQLTVLLQLYRSPNPKALDIFLSIAHQQRQLSPSVGQIRWRLLS